MTPDASLRFLSSNQMFCRGTNLRRRARPVVVASFLGDEMPHAVCLSPAGYRTDLQERVCSRSRSLSICGEALVSKTWTSSPPLVMNCSQAGLVVRPAPPVTLRRLVFPVSGHLNHRSFHNALHRSNNRRQFRSAIAPFRERPGLAWIVRQCGGAADTGTVAFDRITPAVGAMPPSRP
jgi:hypothetical protein